MPASFDPSKADFTKVEFDRKCPIWETRARVDFDAENIHQKFIISPRAGGYFCLTDMAGFGINEWSSQDKAKLSSWILERNRLGEIPVVNEQAIKSLRFRNRATFASRVDNALLFLLRASVSLGTSVKFSRTDMYETTPASQDHLAWLSFCVGVEAASSGEGEFILNHLNSTGLVRQVHGNNDLVQITAAGYARLDELRNERAVNPAKAFVAMWFDPSMDVVWKNGIEPGIYDVGYTPIRIDQKEHNNKIDDEIVAEIRESRFIVADFTAAVLERDGGTRQYIARGGVYFEAGFAQGLGIPVVWCCRSDLIEMVHFDTRQFSHVIWSSPEDLREKLSKRIRAVIGLGPNVMPDG